MTDEVNGKEASTPVGCLKDPIVADPQLEHTSPLLSPEWFWRDLVEMRSKPPDPVENTLSDIRGEALEVANPLGPEFDLVWGAHHLRPYLLATSPAGIPRSPRRLACRLRRSLRSTVARRDRPFLVFPSTGSPGATPAGALPSPEAGVLPNAPRLRREYSSRFASAPRTNTDGRPLRNRHLVCSSPVSPPLPCPLSPSPLPLGGNHWAASRVIQVARPGGLVPA